MRVIEAIFTFVILSSAINACPDEPFCKYCIVPPSGVVCGSCYHSFFNSTTKKCDTNVPRKVENCASYKKTGNEYLCETCDLGYSLADNTCTKCKVANCAYCLAGGEGCSACFNGMMPKLVDGQIVCSDDVKCDIDNCDVCNFATDPQKKCLLCNQGFAILWETKMCIPAPDNCYLTFKNLVSGCWECRDGFYKSYDIPCKPNPAEAPSASPLLAHSRVKTIRRSSAKVTSVTL